MRGIVMEIHDGQAVLLEDEGGFRTVCAMDDWTVGDVVTVSEPVTRQKPRRLRAGALASITAIALFTVGLYHFMWQQVALVSIDVNPSVEIGLNRGQRVLSATGLNEEGQAAVEAANIRNQPYAEALSMLLGEGGLYAYIGDKGYLLFSVQADSEQVQAQLMDVSRQTTYQALPEGGGHVEVDALPVDGETVREAHGHGMSAGRYATLLALTDVDPDATIEAYSHCTIGEIHDRLESSGGGHHGHGQR